MFFFFFFEKHVKSHQTPVILSEAITISGTIRNNVATTECITQSMNAEY